MTQNVPNLRRSVVDLLELLSSSEKQLEYERAVPHDISAELLCMWFDDFYIPDSESFKHSFSQEELAAMADFNNYYFNHEKLLPDTCGGITSWLTNEVWQGIMQKAKETLAVFRQ